MKKSLMVGLKGVVLAGAVFSLAACTSEPVEDTSKVEDESSLEVLDEGAGNDELTQEELDLINGD